MVRGKKVGLRPVQRLDLPVLEAWINDPLYNSEYNDFGFQYAGQLAAQFDKDGFLHARGGALTIFELATEKIIGSVSYHQVVYGPNEGSRPYNIGITLALEQRGKGYGVEAQYLLADYLLSTYPVMRIEAATDVTNISEQRALEKAGFTREGVVRRAQWRSGDWHDLVIYSKLRGE